MVIELKTIRYDTQMQSDLLKRDLKLWFEGILVTLVITLFVVVTLMPRFTGH